MHDAIVATVGLLLLSVAALPAAAAGPGAPAEPAGSPYASAASGTAVVATAGGATDARRGRALALPGVDSIGTELVVAVLGLVGLLLGAGAHLVSRGRSSPSGRAGGEADEGRVEGNGVPATAPPTRNPDGDGSPAVRTDEEYVVQLLIANHGRMKQAQIVEETDWSKAKVSRLLSRMEEREQVVRERAGREKIVQLADANTSIPL